MRELILIAIFTCGVAAAQSAQPPSLRRSGERPDELQRRIEALESEVAALKGDRDRSSYWIQVFRDFMDAMPKNSAKFMAGDKKQVVNYTNAGLIAVAIGATTRYPGGYKLEVFLMPLSGTVMTNVALSIRYGRALRVGKEHPDEWEQARHTKDTLQEFRLPGSKWTRAEVVLAAAKADELETFEVKVLPGGIESPRSLYGLGTQ